MSFLDQNNDKDEAGLLGQKLGLFIASMPVSDEAKASMVQAALMLNEEELMEFTASLEAKFLDFKTQDIDKEFVKEVNAIKAEFDNRKKNLSEKTMNALNDLEAEFEKELGNL